MNILVNNSRNTKIHTYIPVRCVNTSLVGPSALSDLVGKSSSSGATGSTGYTGPSGSGTQMFVDTSSPMGFTKRSDTLIFFDNTTRTFTISPRVSSYIYYWKSLRIEKFLSESITIPNIEGIWYFYFNNTTLECSQTIFDDFSIVPISTVYWNADSSTNLSLTDDRHNCIMDVSTRNFIKDSFGMKYVSGLNLSCSTTGTGNLDTDAEIDISTGRTTLEDIEISYVRPYSSSILFSQDLQLPAQIPVFYKMNAGIWKYKVVDNFCCYQTPTTLCYNKYVVSWTLSTIINSYFVASWILSTNNTTYPIICVLGQYQDQTLDYSKSSNIISSLDLTGLPFDGRLILYRIIFQSSVSYLNNPHARIVDVLDLREAQTEGIQGPIGPTGSGYDVSVDTKSPMGFTNNTDSKISFNDSTGLFTISPSVVEYVYYYQGLKKTKTISESVSITDIVGLWYFYFDNETLTASQTEWNIFNHVPIAYIYWDYYDSESLFFCDERHMVNMDKSTQNYLNNISPMTFGNGLLITGKTTGDGNSDVDAEINVENGLMCVNDLDIEISNPYVQEVPYSQNLSLPAEIPVFYKYGNLEWYRNPISFFPVYESSGSRIYFNSLSGSDWDITLADDNNFVASWILSISSTTNPIICVIGQRQDTDLLSSKRNNTIDSLVLTNFSMRRKVLFRLIYQTKNTYINSVKSRLVDITDFRNTIYMNHNTLFGLEETGSHKSSAISVDSTRFINNLSINENSVQNSLEKLDKLINMSAGTGLFVNNTIYNLNASTGTITNIYSSNIVCSSSGLFTNTTNSTSSTGAPVIMKGGLGVSKDVYIGGNENITGYSLNKTNLVSQQPHGFENHTDSTMTYNPNTQTFIIAPTSTSYTVWVNGIKYTYTTPQQLTHPSTQGVLYYVYYDITGTLQISTTFPTIGATSRVSYIYYYSPTIYMFSNERHLCQMSGLILKVFHQTTGMYYVSGLVMSNYNTQPSNPIDSDNQYSISSGVVSDEGLEHTLSSISSGLYSISYFSGNTATSQWSISNIYPYLYQTDSYIYYNQYTGGNWVLTPLQNHYYVNYYIVGTNAINSNAQILSIMGQTQYSTLTDAEGENFTDLTVGFLGGVEDFVVLYKIIFGTGSYSTIGMCRIESVSRILKTRTQVSRYLFSHNSLSGIQMAGDGNIIYGHISDNSQTLLGNKTFGNNIDVYGTGIFSNTTDATSTTGAGVIMKGGVGISKSVYIGGDEITTGYSLNKTNLVSKQPHGFENNTDSKISYDSTTRTFTISPNVSSYVIWNNGVKYTYNTTQQVSHVSTAGLLYYIYYDSSGVLQISTSPSSISNDTIISTVYYYSSTIYMFSDERHLCQMSGLVHKVFHQTVGTYYVSGLDMSNYNLQPSNPINSDNQLSISSGIISDDGLEINVSSVSSGGYSVSYLTGATNLSTWSINNTYPFLYSVGSYIQYNQYTGGNWVLTPLTTNQWINYYILVSNAINTTAQILIIIGQTFYSTLTDATNESFSELTIGSLNNIPEYVVLYKITFKTSSSYSTIGKCRIDYVSRILKTRLQISSSITSHNSLSNIQMAGAGDVVYGHISDTSQTLLGNKTFGNNLEVYGTGIFSNTSDAISSSTGASVIIKGGVGIQKKLYIDGTINSSNTTDISSVITVGAIYTAGGIRAKKKIAGNSLYARASDVENKCAIMSYDIVNGHGLIEAYDFDNGNTAKPVSIGSGSIFKSLNTTDATSTTGAGAVFSGGVGIQKKLYVGGVLYSTNTTDATSPTGAGAIFSGGVGIQKKLCVGDTTDTIGTSTASAIFSGGILSSKKILSTSNVVVSDSNYPTASLKTIQNRITKNSLNFEFAVVDPYINWYDNPSGSWTKIVWSPKLRLFCMINNSSSLYGMAVSPNGKNWKVIKSTKTSTRTCIAWSESLGYFVVLSNDGTGNRIEVSQDGYNWTIIDSSSVEYIWSIVYWNQYLGNFIAVDWNGTMMTSTDAINWTVSANTLIQAPYDITWSPELNLYVLVAYPYTIATSSNGINWTLKTQGANKYVRSVTWSSEYNMFVVLHNSDGAYISYDGINWTEIFYNIAPVTSGYRIRWIPELGNFFISLSSISGSGNGLIMNSNGLNSVWTSCNIPFNSGFTITGNYPASNNVLNPTTYNLSDIIYAPEIGVLLVGGYGSGSGNVFSGPLVCKCESSKLPDQEEWPVLTGLMNTWKSGGSTTGRNWIYITFSESGKIIIICTTISFFVSYDFGQSFKEFEPSGLSPKYVVAAISDDGHYAFVSNNNTDSKNLYVSSDYCETWTELSLTGNPLICGDCSGDGKYMYVGCGTSKYMYRSSDYGVNWSIFKTMADNVDGVYVSTSGQYVLMFNNHPASSGGTTYYYNNYCNSDTPYKTETGGGYHRGYMSKSGRIVLIYEGYWGQWCLSTNYMQSYDVTWTAYNSNVGKYNRYYLNPIYNNGGTVGSYDFEFMINIRGYRVVNGDKSNYPFLPFSRVHCNKAGTLIMAIDYLNNNVRIMRRNAISSNVSLIGNDTPFYSLCTNDAISTTGAGAVFSGGVSIQKKLYVDGVVTLSNTTNAYSGQTLGALLCSGGIRATGNIFGNAIVAKSTADSNQVVTWYDDANSRAELKCNNYSSSAFHPVSVNAGCIFQSMNTTDATSSTGAGAVFSGGVGIAKKLYVGDELNAIMNQTTGQSTTRILNNSLADSSIHSVCLGYSQSANNSMEIQFYKSSNGSASNYGRFKVLGAGNTIDIYNNKFEVDFTTDATSTTGAGAVFSGGVGIDKKLYVGGELNNIMNQTSGESVTRILNSSLADLNFHSLILGKARAGYNSLEIQYFKDATSAENNYGRIKISGSGQTIDFTNTLFQVKFPNEASSTTGAGAIFTGGVGIQKKLYVGGDINMGANTKLYSNYADGSFFDGQYGQIQFKTSNTNAWTGISNTAGSGYFQIYNNFAGNPMFKCNGTADASSTTNASATFSGGVGIAKNLFVGGGMDVQGTLDASSTTLASVTIKGGLGVSKKLYVGTGIYLPTSGGTPTILDYYEEYLFTTNMAGAYSLSNIQFTIVRIGNVITISSSGSLDGTKNGATPYLISSSGIPTRFTPLSYSKNSSSIQSLGGTAYPFSFLVQANSLLVIGPMSSVTWNNGVTANISGISITYILN